MSSYKFDHINVIKKKKKKLFFQRSEFILKVKFIDQLTKHHPNLYK